MTMYDIISKKRRSGTLSDEEIRYVVDGVTHGTIPDYQTAALMMAICFQGMDERETATLTDAMAHSGDMIDLSRFGGASVDKHSTGGVGDKTTMIVAPIVAALGGKVAKMSGRGLGHTGGTLDKLESIPGFSVDMTPEKLMQQCEEIGIAVAGQTGNLAPADKKLYALRDVTATVDSIPLICSSIMSKKLAAGSKSIVLDVKVGSGAFAKTQDFAEELAKNMIAIGKACGRNMTAVISNMDQPLGWAVGNALEVKEAIDVLSGVEVPDLKQLCVELAANMVSLCHGWEIGFARAACKQAISSGLALAKFKEWVAAQGGDPAVADDTSLLPHAAYKATVVAPCDGFIQAMDTEAIGSLCVKLGAGRKEMGDSIDPAAGIVFRRKTGNIIKTGLALATVYGNDEAAVNAVAQELLGTMTFGTEAPETLPLICAVVR